MSWKRTARTLPLLAVGVSIHPASSSDHHDVVQHQQAAVLPSVADVLLGDDGAAAVMFDSDALNFNILAHLVSMTGLVDPDGGALRCGGLAGRTVLAPTDGAFLDLAADLGYYAPSGGGGDAGTYDEAAVFRHISAALELYGRPLDETARSVVLFHVLHASLKWEKIRGMTAEQLLPPNPDPDAEYDDPVLLEEPRDVATCNGLVQVIGNVLLPMPLETLKPAPAVQPPSQETAAVLPSVAGVLPSVADVLLGDDEAAADGFDSDASNFNILAHLAVLTGLISTDGGTLRCGGLANSTVLAPDDRAFLDLAADLGYYASSGGDNAYTYDEAAIYGHLASAFERYGPLIETARSVVLFHVLDGVLSWDEVADRSAADVLFPAHPDYTVDYDDPALLDTPRDVATCNGLVQVIGNVLLPMPLKTLKSASMPALGAPPASANEVAVLPSVADVLLGEDGAAADGFDSDTTNFNILAHLVDLAGLISTNGGTLQCGGLAASTVLAPDDRAFFDLAVLLGHEDYDASGTPYDEAAVYGRLASAFERYGPLVETVRSVVLFHVMDGALSWDEVAGKSAEDDLSPAHPNPAVDYDPALLDTPRDIETCNGLVQVIGNILLPMPLKTLKSAFSSSEDVVPCSSDFDCVADSGRLALDDCGTARCDDEGRCEFNAWVDDGDCESEYFEMCDQDDHKCKKGPAGSIGTCTGWNNNECVYTWRPKAKKEEKEDEDDPTEEEDPPKEEEEDEDRCRSDSDCVADYGRLDLETCGNVRCNSEGRCEFNAWNNDGDCESEYYKTCGGDHNKCKKGPAGSVGTCTGHKNNECVYTWHPKAKGRKCKKATGCQSDSDCAADTAGRLDLGTCGSVKCISGLGRCEFDAWKDDGQCENDYYVWCNHDDAKCTKGPAGSAGTCTGWMQEDCVYSWCPFE